MRFTRVVTLYLVFGLFGLTSCLPRVPSRGYSQPGDGYRFCAKIANQADRTSTASLTIGVLAATAAAAGVIIGNVIGPDTSSSSVWERNRNSLTVSLSALLALPAAYWISRATAASAASESASRALQFANGAKPSSKEEKDKKDSAEEEAAEPPHGRDRRAFDLCLDARAAWIGQRDKAASVFSERLKAIEEMTKKAADNAEEAKDAAESAGKKADNASKGAAEASKNAKDASAKASSAENAATGAKKQAEEINRKATELRKSLDDARLKLNKLNDEAE
jgi:methyl-accepting chemotaxis protein